MTPDMLDDWSRLGFWTGEMPWARLAIYLVLSTFVLGNIGTYLRHKRGWRDGDTRKLSHFGHMVIATPLLVFLPPVKLLPAAFIATVAVIAVYGVAACSKRPLLNGIVASSLRERDWPRRRFFFFFPLVAGNVALVAAILVFPIESVRVAFFTAAIADGCAEPVGLRLGRTNTFHVKDPVWGSTNTKSVAGSMAVFITSPIIALLFFALQGGIGPAGILGSIAYGAVVTALEALAPRGFDNMLLLFLAPLAIIAIAAVAG